jgi:hypothetical protein
MRSKFDRLSQKLIDIMLEEPRLLPRETSPNRKSDKLRSFFVRLYDHHDRKLQKYLEFQELKNAFPTFLLEKDYLINKV